MELDLTRAPLGAIAAEQLVKAAAKIGDLGEKHYLELKGPPDLDSKRNKQKIAKFILAAANRMPGRAAEAFDGYGVLIVGITEDGVTGIEPVEILELSQVITPFLGVEGPRWDVVYVPVEGSSKMVLIVAVDPPKDGQPVFVCRADGDGLKDGRVYVRGDGETREALSAELDLLTKRSRARSADDVDLEVSVGPPVTPVDLDLNGTLEDHIRTVRARLLDALPPTSGSPYTTTAVAFGQPRMPNLLRSAGLFGEVPEDRTQEQYCSELSEWEDDFRKAWPAAVLLLLGEILTPMVVTVANRTKKFLEDLEVKIHLEGDIRGVTYTGDDNGLPSLGWLELPTPPRPWGPKQNPALSVSALRPVAHPGNWSLPSAPSRFTWSNSGSVDIELHVGDLRPSATCSFDDEEVVLVLGSGQTPDPIHGTWQITARGYDHVFTGALTVDLGAAADATTAMRSILSLD